MRDFHLPGRSPVLATNGAVATSHPIAAKVALDILQGGGNAADAAIAAAAVLNIAEPQSCGLGGDCFVLVKPAGEERIEALNGSGRAPAALDAAELRARGLERIGTESVEAVTMPGAVDAFCALDERFGKIGLAACLAPAIRYAEEGIPVAPRVAFDWQRAAHRLAGSARDRYLKGGAPLATGDIFRAPAQAEVLRRIAAEGRAGFYGGEVAADLIASLAALGGTHTPADLEATACDWCAPISGRYRDHELVEHPPNGQGAAAILLLKILDGFDLASLDPSGPERAHLQAEAAKLAYDARDRFIADPAHLRRLDHMLADATARRLAALIDPGRARSDFAQQSEAVHRDTVYVCTVDRDGMAVSLIYSIFWSFGSGLASERFGILFQNRGAGFTLAPGHPNEAAGGKRPLHTIIPAMLKAEGRVIMPFGVMGGAYQAMGHAHVVSNLVDFGMDPQAALDAPRSFPEAGLLKTERGYPAATLAALARLGHRIEMADAPLGGGQMIRIDHRRGVLVAASDPRKDGCALGY